MKRFLSGLRLLRFWLVYHPLNVLIVKTYYRPRRRDLRIYGIRKEGKLHLVCLTHKIKQNPPEEFKGSQVEEFNLLGLLHEFQQHNLSFENLSQFIKYRYLPLIDNISRSDRNCIHHFKEELLLEAAPLIQLLRDKINK